MNRYVKIGLFVLITGSGSIFYVMQTADTIDAPDTYELQAYIEDASGLRPGTQIWVSGVAVGRIQDIALDRGQALLMMELSTEVPVYRDAVIRKQTQSLLGNAIVALEPGTPSAIPVSHGGLVPNVVATTSMERAFNSAEQVAAEMETFMAGLNSFMTEKGGYSTLEEILTLSRDTVATTNRLVESNMLLLQESLESIAAITARLEANSGQDLREISAILAHTASITERIDRILADQDTQVNDSVASLRESIDYLNASLSNVAAITSRVEQGEGSLGKLINDEKLYERIDRVAKNVDEFVDSTMGMELQVGFSSEYLTLGQTTRNTAELRLVPRDKNKYYSFGLVSTPDGTLSETETRVRQDTNSDGTIDSDTTTFESERSDQLKFSAQLARSFGPLTIRGGVIENSAGFGLGLKPTKQVALSSELFSFTGDVPYLRGYGTFFPVFDPSSANPLNWLYLTGGVDNALSDERDYFLGLGLRLTDNDLKGVLPFVPSP
jgi:phospholipid/cholesterol/gamma-HCH transport system substrate-binding protein